MASEEFYRTQPYVQPGAMEGPSWGQFADQSRRAYQEMGADLAEEGRMRGEALKNERTFLPNAALAGVKSYQEQSDRMEAQKDREQQRRTRQLEQEQMERSGTRDVKFGDEEAAARMEQMKSGTEMTKAQAKVARLDAIQKELETASYQEKRAPGSAAKFVPGGAQKLARMGLPPDLSLAAYVDAMGVEKGDVEMQTMQGALERDKRLLPLQVQQAIMGIQTGKAQLAQMGQSMDQNAYLANRQRLTDSIDDQAKMMATLDPQTQEAVLQAASQKDPKFAALLISKVRLDKAAKDLQAATTEATINPEGFAVRQQGVADIQQALKGSQVLEQASQILKEYEKEAYLGVSFSNLGENLRAQMSALAAQVPGFERYAEELQDSELDFPREAKKFLAALSGQLRTSTKSPHLNQQGQAIMGKVNAILDQMDKALGILPTDEKGNVDPLSFRNSAKGGGQQAPGTPAWANKSGRPEQQAPKQQLPANVGGAVPQPPQPQGQRYFQRQGVIPFNNQNPRG